MQADVNVHREGYGRARIEARQQAAVGAVAQHVPGTIIPVHDLVDGMVAVPLGRWRDRPLRGSGCRHWSLLHLVVRLLLPLAARSMVPSLLKCIYWSMTGLRREAQADGVAAAAPGGPGWAVPSLKFLCWSMTGSGGKPQADGVVAAAPGGQVGVARRYSGSRARRRRGSSGCSGSRTWSLKLKPPHWHSSRPKSPLLALPAHIPDAASAPRLLDNYHEGRSEHHAYLWPWDTRSSSSSLRLAQCGKRY